MGMAVLLVVQPEASSLESAGNWAEPGLGAEMRTSGALIPIIILGT